MSSVCGRNALCGDSLARSKLIKRHDCQNLQVTGSH